MQKPVHYEDIERQLIAIFRAVLFEPVIADLRAGNPAVAKKRLLNAADPLGDAIRAGKVQYQDGTFSGTFGAAVSRAIRALGAKFDERKRVFVIKPANVPDWVKAAATTAQARAVDTHQAIKSTLDDLQVNLDTILERAAFVKAGSAIDSFVADFKGVAKAISVSPTLTPAAKARLEADYNNNMKLWIRKWCEEEIVDLRSRVEQNATEGARFDRLIDMIQSRYSVSQSKAQFLARQETALFMAKFRRERVSEAGVTEYRWSTSHDERVRKIHRELDGKRYFYATPPIVDPIGRRGNPGEDFNCRCVDIPILPSERKAA